MYFIPYTLNPDETVMFTILQGMFSKCLMHIKWTLKECGSEQFANIFKLVHCTNVDPHVLNIVKNVDWTSNEHRTLTEHPHIYRTFPIPFVGQCS